MLVYVRFKNVTQVKCVWSLSQKSSMGDDEKEESNNKMFDMDPKEGQLEIGES